MWLGPGLGARALWRSSGPDSQQHLDCSTYFRPFILAHVDTSSIEPLLTIHSVFNSLIMLLVLYRKAVARNWCRYSLVAFSTPLAFHNALSTSLQASYPYSHGCTSGHVLQLTSATVAV